jgi:MFS family permease
MTAASPATPAEGKKGHLFGFKMPDFSVLKDGRVQTLIYAKNVQKLGIATLSYGASIYLADTGASQIEVSLVACTGYVAALMFGFQGGTVVDSISKRTAMALGYAAMAILCFVVPVVFGTDVPDLIVLAFLVAVLGTVTGPSIKAAVALVATPAAMATVASVLNLFGSFGTAIGQAFVAPILIKVWGIDGVMYGAGIILLSGAIWSLKVPKEAAQKSVDQALRDVDWKPQALDLRGIARWVMSARAVATIVLVGAVVVALGETVGTLIPVYVRDVLEADPASSVFIFAPAGLGYLAGMLAAPWAIARWGARRFGFAAFLITGVGIMLFGLVDLVAPILAPISPTRLFELLPNVELSDKVLAAGFIALPANFGSTATGASVQVYINQKVPLLRQGGVFGMEEVVENSLTIVAILLLGAIATWLGSEVVFIVAPFIVMGFIVWLIRYSYRRAGEAVPNYRTVVDQLWEGPGDEEAEEPRATAAQGQ